MDVTEQSLYADIKECKPGNHTRDLGVACEAVVTTAGFSVVKDVVGPGVGAVMHEEPQVLTTLG